VDTLIAFAAALADALMEPKVEGQPRKLKVTAGALALVAAILIGVWIHYRTSVLEDKVDQVVRSTDRIENALIMRGARASSTPTPTPDAFPWAFVPSASADPRIP
jgi:hypothetical protein